MAETKLQMLRRQHGETYAPLAELLNKVDRTDDETKLSEELADQCRVLKAAISEEEALERAEAEHRAFHADAVRDLPLPGGARGGDGASAPAAKRRLQLVGLDEAGSVRLDSHGSVLEEVGPGALGEKRWQAIQDPEYARVFRSYLRKGFNLLTPTEQRAISPGLDDQGGVFIPIDQLMTVIQRKPTPTRLAGLVTTITTGRDKVQMPAITANGSDSRYGSPVRVTWGGTKPAASATAVDMGTGWTGPLEINVYNAQAIVDVPIDLIDDSAFGLQTWFMNEFASVYDLTRDDMILNGLGSAVQPTGILTVTGSSSEFRQVPTTNVGNPVTADGVLDVTGQIEEQYDENQVIVMRKTSTWRAVRKLKDSQNRYLVGMDSPDAGGFTGPGRRTLDGYPVVFSGFMPTTGAGNKIILSGDLRGYWIAQRLGLVVQVLRETKAEQGQVQLLARFRFGGLPIEPWRMRVGVQT